MSRGGRRLRATAGAFSVHQHAQVPKALEMAAPAHCNLWGHAARTFFNLNHVIVERKGGGAREEGFLEKQLGVR